MSVSYNKNTQNSKVAGSNPAYGLKTKKSKKLVLVFFFILSVVLVLIVKLSLLVPYFYKNKYKCNTRSLLTSTTILILLFS